MMWVQLGFPPDPSQRMATTESSGMETDPTPRLSAKKPSRAAAIPGKIPRRGPWRDHAGTVYGVGGRGHRSQSSFR